MKLLLIILLLTSIMTAAQTGSNLEKANQCIADIKTKFAPDKRTIVFNIEAEENSGRIVLKGETSDVKLKERLISELGAMDINDSIEVLPAEELGDKVFGVVNLSVANIRSNPQHSAEMSTQALLGTPVKVLKKHRDWYYVQTPDEYLGWVDDDGIEPKNRELLEKWTAAEKIIVIKDFGTAYSAGDRQSEPVSDIVKGDILAYAGTEGDYIKGEFPDGRIGYIPSDEAFRFDEWLKNVELTQENILSTARQFMGIPYLWGGTSVKGVDCSGFTKSVYYFNGVILPRDASQQVHVGEAVDTETGFENLQPGDLLFFGSKADGEKMERVVHVGIYIGDMEFIHSSGRVKINSLDKTKPNFSEYRFNTFLRAKRILTSANKNGVKLVDGNLFKNN